MSMEREDLVNWIAGEPEIQLSVINGSLVTRVIHGGRLVKKYEQSLATIGGDPEACVMDFQGAATSMTRLAVADLVAVAKGML